MPLRELLADLQDSPVCIHHQSEGIHRYLYGILQARFHDQPDLHQYTLASPPGSGLESRIHGLAPSPPPSFVV